MDVGNLIMTKEASIARITFNRPNIMNALDLKGIKEFSSILDKISDDAGIKVVILTGEGKAFCAGGELKFFLSLYENGVEATRNFIIEANKIIEKITNSDKFFIASVNGDAIGGGFSYALASDTIIASEKARFGLSFMKIGLIPDTGMSYFIPRLVGPIKAKELFASGEMLSAAEAYKLNIISKVVPHNELKSATDDMAIKFSENPSLAMGFLKTLINKSLNADNVQTVLGYESVFQTQCLQSKESKKLIQAFFKKKTSIL